MSWKGWCIACDILSPFFVVCGLFLSLVTSFAAITSKWGHCFLPAQQEDNVIGRQSEIDWCNEHNSSRK